VSINKRLLAIDKARDYTCRDFIAWPKCWAPCRPLLAHLEMPAIGGTIGQIDYHGAGYNPKTMPETTEQEGRLANRWGEEEEKIEGLSG